MTKRIIAPGITLIGSKSVSVWDREQNALKAPAKKSWREEALDWLSDPANYDDENYSDIFKDVFGSRPGSFRL